MTRTAGSLIAALILAWAAPGCSALGGAIGSQFDQSRASVHDRPDCGLLVHHVNEFVYLQDMSGEEIHGRLLDMDCKHEILTLKVSGDRHSALDVDEVRTFHLEDIASIRTTSAEYERLGTTIGVIADVAVIGFVLAAISAYSAD